MCSARSVSCCIATEHLSENVFVREQDHKKGSARWREKNRLKQVVVISLFCAALKITDHTEGELQYVTFVNAWDETDKKKMHFYFILKGAKCLLKRLAYKAPDTTK